MIIIFLIVIIIIIIIIQYLLKQLNFVCFIYREFKNRWKVETR